MLNPIITLSSFKLVAIQTKFEFGSDIVYMAMLNAKHVGTRQSSRLLYRPVYKEVFSPPGVTDEPQNVFHDALLNYQKHYLLF